jgi:probable HAF family extracellular repeat protein
LAAERKEANMKRKFAMCVSALGVIALVALPSHATAQQFRSAPYPYILVDLGTFGGPNAYLNLPGQTMNARGAVIGSADMTTPDPFAPNCANPDCFVALGFVWQHGGMTKLDSLPGGGSSGASSINAGGLIVGTSETGVIDPLTGFPEARAVLWQDGQILDLGTLPGGHESAAGVVNDRGMVAGPASNATPDSYSCAFFACWGTQTRAYLWQNGVMQDLGTLGGPDSFAVFMNNRGQIAGQSYTNRTPNPVTGQPTMDPFLWERGHMRDLGSLGGTFGLPNGMNNRGEVVGQSDLAGDQALHPFLWDGHALRDLGTLGGDFASAVWINEHGAVTGWATTSGNRAAHAFLWRNGEMTDLGAAPGDTCSFPESINERDQVVGHSGLCGTPESAYRGTLWEHGAAYSLDALVAPSALSVLDGLYISDRGEIVGYGVLPNGDQHVILLVPASLAALEGVMSNAPAPGTVAPAVTPHASAAPCASVLPWKWKAPPATWRARLAHRYQLPCLGG